MARFIESISANNITDFITQLNALLVDKLSNEIVAIDLYTNDLVRNEGIELRASVDYTDAGVAQSDPYVSEVFTDTSLQAAVTLAEANIAANPARFYSGHYLLVVDTPHRITQYYVILFYSDDTAPAAANWIASGGTGGGGGSSSLNFIVDPVDTGQEETATINSKSIFSLHDAYPDEFLPGYGTPEHFLATDWMRGGRLILAASVDSGGFSWFRDEDTGREVRLYVETQYDPYDGVGAGFMTPVPDAYIGNRSNVDGEGTALSFGMSGVSGAGKRFDQVGAQIAFKRTGSNSRGQLDLAVKNNTLSGGKLIIGLSILDTGVTNIIGGTDSTSTTDGQLVVTGGVGISRSAYINELVPLGNQSDTANTIVGLDASTIDGTETGCSIFGSGAYSDADYATVLGIEAFVDGNGDSVAIGDYTFCNGEDSNSIGSFCRVGDDGSVSRTTHIGGDAIRGLGNDSNAIGYGSYLYGNRMQGIGNYQINGFTEALASDQILLGHGAAWSGANTMQIGGSRSTLAVSSKSGNFTDGEVITGGTSGATAKAADNAFNNILDVAMTSATSFQVGEIITGSISGHTATVDSVTDFVSNITTVRFNRGVDVISFANPISLNGVGSDIIPTIDGNYRLGNSSSGFAELFLTDFMVIGSEYGASDGFIAFPGGFDVWDGNSSEGHYFAINNSGELNHSSDGGSYIIGITAESTSPTDGAFQVQGGVGISKALNVGNAVEVNTGGSLLTSRYGNASSSSNPFGSLPSAPSQVGLSVGYASSSSGATRAGIMGYSSHGDPSDNPAAVYGITAFGRNNGSNDAGTLASYGIWAEGRGQPNAGAGDSVSYGIYARATNADTNWAGFFAGHVNVSGYLLNRTLLEIVSATGTLSRQNNKKVIVDTAAVTVSLWTTSIADGDQLYIRNKSGGSITVDTAGAETIEGAASEVLLNGESRLYVYHAATSDWTVF